MDRMAERRCVGRNDDCPDVPAVPAAEDTRPMVAAFALLVVAIAIEVASTAALPRTDGFRNPVWAAAVVAGYAASIWMLSLVVQRLPVSVTYAVWAGLGTAVIAVIGVLFLGESWNPVKVTAIGLIVVGVVVLNLEGAH